MSYHIRRGAPPLCLLLGETLSAADTHVAAAAHRASDVGAVPWIAVGVGAGVAGYFMLPAEPPGWLGLALSGAAVAGFWLGRADHRVVAAMVAVFSVAIGLTAAQGRSALVAGPVLTRELTGVAVTGRVARVERTNRGARLVLVDAEVEGLTPAQTPRRLRVTVAGRDHLLPRPGGVVRLRGTFGPPPGPPAPGAFDFGRSLFFQGIGGSGFSFGGPLILDDGMGRWMGRLAGIRQGVSERVLDALPGDRGAVAAALLAGTRSEISETAVTAMRAAGLAHLLAISGLHMGLVAGIIMATVRGGLARWPQVALTRPIKKWAAIAGLAASFGYLLLAGAPLPTQRAFIMTGLVLIAVVADRSAISLRLVALAALAILLLRPESLLSASFQLSFGAVVALVAAYEALTPYLSEIHRRGGVIKRIGLYFSGVALTTVIATAATVPLGMQLFNTVPLFGLAANVVAVPLTALWVMPWGLVALALMPVGLESLALVPMGWGIGGVLWVAGGVAQWPGAVMTVAALPTAGFAVVVAGGLWLCLGRTWWRLLGGVAVLAGLLTGPLVAAPDVMIDARVVGWRGGDELLVSNGRRGAFVRGVWLRRAGLTDWRRVQAPASEAGAGWRLECDGAGCVYSKNGGTVAVVADSQGLLEDCGRVDVVVDLSEGASAGGGNAGNCQAQVISRKEIARDGPTALWLTETGVRIATSNEARRRRPWGGVTP